VTATPRDINIRDGRLTVRALMRSWLPLSEAILRMVVRAVPNPAQAQQSKMSKLVFDPMGALQTDYSASWSGEAGKCVAARLKAAVNGISSCDNSRDCDVVVFLSKMVPVRVSELRSEDIQHLNREIKNKDASAPALDVVKGEVLMSLGRVFSGVVTRQSRLLLLPHRHDPITDITANFDKIEGIPLDCSPEFLTSPCTPLHGGDLGVYLVFGPSVIAVDEIPAGNIIGIVGIADYVLKTGTLSSTWACPTLKAMTFQAKPIVRVAVEPVNYYDLARLEKGLRMLYQYDPAVEVGVDVSSGQQTMACLGEIHQEQCVKYLVEKFAKCEIRVSEPIVPFRESLLAPIPSFKPSLPQPWRDQVDTSRSPSSGKFWLDSEMVSILIRCVPLPLEFIQLFDDNLGLKSSIQRFAAQKCIDAEVSTAGIVEWDTVSQILMQAISEQGPYDGAALERRIVALGPDEGDAINVAVLAADFTLDIWEGHKPAYPFSGLSPGASLAIDSPHDKALQLIWARCQSAVAAGFQLCVASGPLMGEPLHAVCFIIEKMHISSECILLPADQVITTLTGDCSSGIGVSISTGQLIPEVRCNII
jgi:ribosome assembly protein 1